MKVTARQVAVRALDKVSREGAYSNLALDSLLEGSGLSPRDNAFATALFYGVLERQITLDGCIARHSKLPLRKLDGVVREILRISLYQMLYMDGVPDSAAVSEGVALTKVMGKTSAAGFVNGVLRSFLREGKVAVAPQGGATREQELSLRYSAPLWLVELLLGQYGEEDAVGILAASLGKPPLYLRANTLRTTPAQLAELLGEQGVVAQEDDTLPGCLLAEGTGDLAKLPAYREGLFHVPDKASQLAALALDVRPGQRVLDVCAAPGGKSFTLAQYLENTGELLSGDIHPQRVGLIAQGAQRLGLTSLRAIENDATGLQIGLGLFDRILCDVPCSGLGIIRRKPEIKYKNPEEFAPLPTLQYKILRISANYLDEGGVLLYSTCTLRQEENLAVVEEFLQNHPDFEPHPLPDRFGENGGYHTTLLPHRGGTDGFFIATIRRKQ